MHWFNGQLIHFTATNVSHAYFRAYFIRISGLGVVVFGAFVAGFFVDVVFNGFVYLYFSTKYCINLCMFTPGCEARFPRLLQ